MENSQSERPYSLYASQQTREKSSAARHASLRKRSSDLQKMRQSISQNLTNMKDKNKPSPSSSKNTSSSIHTQSPPPPPPLLDVPLPTLPTSKTKPIIQSLNSFLTHHLSLHRPIALVTSGGTITTLEQNTIRYLDNFSTGQRGAISVEEFCKRGYAVIHLWRKGSTAPYSRVLQKLLGCQQGNHGLDANALGYLFQGQQSQQQHQIQQQHQQSNNDDEHTGKQVKNDAKSKKSGLHHDPWLTSTKRSNSSTAATTATTSNSDYIPMSDNHYSSQNRMQLTTHILYNNLLQRKLRERADVISNNLLYTLPFTTIEEYLALLKIATEAMRQCQSLGLIYLAAAVSDFYIPEEAKCLHKIQSRNYGIDSNEKAKKEDDDDNDPSDSAIIMNPVDNSISITMQTVPKVIKNIREEWSPHAYCVSFKLETDETILREKVKQAMIKYDVHLVIGNILETRHDKVSLYERNVENVDSFALSSMEVTKTSGSDGDDDDDDLEDNIISHVVEKHFEYIANHYLVGQGNKNLGVIDDDDDEEVESTGYGAKGILSRTALMTGAEAAARHNAMMRKKKEKLQKEMYWKRMKDLSMNITGHALGCYVSFVVSSMLQNHLRR